MGTYVPFGGDEDEYIDAPFWSRSIIDINGRDGCRAIEAHRQLNEHAWDLNPARAFPR